MPHPGVRPRAGKAREQIVRIAYGDRANREGADQRDTHLPHFTQELNTFDTDPRTPGRLCQAPIGTWSWKPELPLWSQTAPPRAL
ncbi:hypothetical protein Pph01_18130 [Planotetraspora phitsanulokensis]|uniref:Uncharacterized protein n=1 Tax=Planotetraspora phitsanulokensis TaxID=575192 RepID=A0A8J3UD25_9ACTN|nr:hypothetical protein Pph01_18130 [Planotetraspora phitsanulokensis]